MPLSFALVLTSARPLLLASFLEVACAAEHLEIVRHGVSTVRLLRFAPCGSFPHDSFYEE